MIADFRLRISDLNKKNDCRFSIWECGLKIMVLIADFRLRIADLFTAENAEKR